MEKFGSRECGGGGVVEHPFRTHPAPCVNRQGVDFRAFSRATLKEEKHIPLLDI